jgi:N-acetylmuramoyl-L-alanine amidase CwlD
MSIRIVALFYIVFLFFPNYHFGKELDDFSISFNDKKVRTYSSIIQSTPSIYHIPLRDIIKRIPAKLEYKRKSDSYRLYNKRFSARLIPNSKEVFINKQRHVLAEKVRIIKGRIYVPATSFFELLGYDVSISESNIAISGKLSTQKKKSLSPTSKHVIASTGNNPKVLTDHYRLPTFSTKRALYLSLFDKKYDISKSFFYKQDILYIHLVPILLKHGFKVSYQKSYIELSFKGVHYMFYKKKNRVDILEKGKRRTLNLPQPVAYHKKRYYISFISFLSALDEGLHWSSSSRTLHVLSKIRRVDLVKKHNRYHFSLISNHPIRKSTPKPLSWAKGYYIDFHNSISTTEKETIKTDIETIPEFQISQVNGYTTRLRVYASDGVASPYVNQENYGLSIHFSSTLTSIKELLSEDGLTVKIEGTHDIQPKVSRSQDGKKLILDLPGTLIDIPQLIHSEHPIFSRIRSSQFSHSPVVSRIVFDLKTPQHPFKLKQHASSLDVIFPKTAPTVAKPTPRKSKPRSQKISSSKISTNHLLSNKVIVLDAGHGGRDPGAIGIGNRYEKHYTLDVAKRLQKLLAAKGALVIMTRQRDVKTGLSRRAYIANKNKADIFISLHFNSFVKSSVHGTETYYYKYKDKKLARHLQRQMAKDLRLKNNGIKRSRLFVLRHTRMPAALVEPGFLTNPSNMAKVKNPDFRQKVAQSLYQGIVNYYRDTPKRKKR